MGSLPFKPICGKRTLSSWHGRRIKQDFNLLFLNRGARI
jgi:hypothetical protein